MTNNLFKMKTRNKAAAENGPLLRAASVCCAGYTSVCKPVCLCPACRALRRALPQVGPRTALGLLAPDADTASTQRALPPPCQAAGKGYIQTTLFSGKRHFFPHDSICTGWYLRSGFWFSVGPSVRTYTTNVPILRTFLL
jgi:hypothetical protein